MFARVIVAAAALGLLAGTAMADTIEVKMLNKGEAGSMVFEPDYVEAKPGDTIHFLATDKGHNVEDIDGMLPEGAAEFKSKMSKDFELTVDVPGFYGVKCTPHYGMGMVALIKVGEADNLDAVKAVKQRGKAKQRFADIFAKVD
ncbi:MAG: pseudoazurin [Stappia sp.]|uniref:pseudoazurin n=1 Tax=Stappia sp. TaxID=1870903 RepID=UPI000C49EED8|nr:pseudoazurin [Stappia sp.]MAA98694.1 pseudoazurin [Stappia sp.]MBM20476.1 pseudoazurin [Stappia sp.]